MEIILKSDIIGLGEEGDICRVADGYARNYLLPKGYALHKTKGNLGWLSHQQNAINERKKQKADEAKSLAERLEDREIILEGKVSSGDKLYGSIHAHQIVEELAKDGIELDHRKIEIPEPIKTVGTHTVRVKLYEGVSSSLKVTVKALEEASEQAEAAAPQEETAEAASAPETEEGTVPEAEATEATETAATPEPAEAAAPAGSSSTDTTSPEPPEEQDKAEA